MAVAAPKGDAFLVNHGSFNPVHRGHIFMMTAAKERVEAAGYRVVSAYLGLTDKDWIHGKGIKALDDDIRVQCCNLLATEMGHSWIRGEVRGTTVGSGFQMIGEVLGPQYPGMTGFNVIGGDLAAKMPPSLLRRKPCVVIGRKGSPLPEEGDGSLLVVATDEDTGDFSSTRLREALAGRDKDLVKKTHWRR